MATTSSLAPAPPAKVKLAPDGYERVLAAGSVVLLGVVVAALLRGISEWGQVPALVWAHIGTILIAVSLTPIMMLRPRGDRLHRRLGWLWCASLALTAALTFGIRHIGQGSLSIIHILSAWTLIQVPLIVWTARNHLIGWHRRAVRGMVTGALLIAGFFTFPFDRLLGKWLFG